MMMTTSMSSFLKMKFSTIFLVFYQVLSVVTCNIILTHSTAAVSSAKDCEHIAIAEFTSAF